VSRCFLVTAMCLPAIDEAYLISTPTDVEEINAIQDYLEDLEWQEWCDIAHERAVKFLDELDLQR
jgi:hypothetical protein